MNTLTQYRICLIYDLDPDTENYINLARIPCIGETIQHNKKFAIVQNVALLELPLNATENNVTALVSVMDLEQ